MRRTPERQTLKDALTEALQSALTCLRHLARAPELKETLSAWLEKLWQTKHTIDPEDARAVREVIDSARIELNGEEGAREVAAIAALETALGAIEEYLNPPAPEIKGESPLKVVLPEIEARAKAESLTSEYLRQTAPEDVGSYIERIAGKDPVIDFTACGGSAPQVEDLGGATIIHDSPDYAKPPTRREIGDKLIDELEAAIGRDLSEGYTLSRLSSLRQLMTEVTGELDYATTTKNEWRGRLEQVLCYVHRRLSASPAPDGVVHLEFILRLASALTTLQSPPTPAEIGAALYRATELSHRKEGAENSLEAEEQKPDAMLALALALVDDIQRATVPTAVYEPEELAKKFAGLRNLIKDLTGAAQALADQDASLDHIPGSVLDELEQSLEEVLAVDSESTPLEWAEDNLERLRILRGCFAAYAKPTEAEELLKDARAIIFDSKGAHYAAWEATGAGELIRKIDALIGVPEADAEPDVEGDHKAPEHEHNVMCLPYHSALREIERRINIYRDDTLEAYNDFGEAVVSKATITAVNTFTAQLIKIITDVAGDTKGYNKGTVEREAHADKGYPKPHLLPTGAHNALVAAKEGLKTVLNGVREANTDESLSETFIKDRVNVVLRYGGYEYVRDALKAVERELHIEITGDKRLPIPEGAEERLQNKREIIDNLNADKIPGVVVAKRLLGTIEDFIRAPYPTASPMGAMKAIEHLRMFIDAVPEWLHTARIEGQDGAPDVKQMIDDKLRESMYVFDKPGANGGGIPPAVLDRIRERIDRAVTERLAAPFKSGAKDRLVAALKDASSALKDAADGSPRILRLEITEGAHNLLTVSAIEIINTLHAALWTCEAERNIYASLGMLNKLREIIRSLDAKAGEGDKLRGDLAVLRDELEVAEEEAHRAQMNYSDLNARQVLANTLREERDKAQTGRIAELLTTRSALRQDVELLSRENELQTSSIIAYMFVVQRLRGCLRAFLDFYKAQIKAVGQIETGEYANLRPEKAGKSPQAYALDLCYEMKAIAESARTMGEDELQLLDKACPSFKMSTREGLTEY